MSQNETPVNVTTLPTPESTDDAAFVLTFNKKKIAKITAITATAAAAVTGAVLYFKKAQDDDVVVEPLEESDGFVVYEAPAQD